MKKILLIELWKISMNICYKAGWITGFLKGTFGLFPKEPTPEEIEARELYQKQLERILEIVKGKKV